MWITETRSFESRSYRRQTREKKLGKKPKKKEGKEEGTNICNDGTQNSTP